MIVKRIPFAGHLYKMTNELVTHRKEEDKSGVIDQIIKGSDMHLKEKKTLVRVIANIGF